MYSMDMGVVRVGWKWTLVVEFEIAAGVISNTGAEVEGPHNFAGDAVMSVAKRKRMRVE